MNHAVDGLVDGSVASGHQNKIRAPINGAACDLTCVSGSTGGNGIDSDPPRVQQLNGALQRMASPSECARVRIINKYGLAEGLDSTLIIVDARHRVLYSLGNPQRGGTQSPAMPARSHRRLAVDLVRSEIATAKIHPT